MYRPIIRKAERLVALYNNTDERTEKLAKQIYSFWLNTVAYDGRPPEHPNLQLTKQQAEWHWCAHNDLIKQANRILTTEAVRWAADVVNSRK